MMTETFYRYPLWKVWHPDGYGAIHVVDAKNRAICRIMSDFVALDDARLIAAAPDMIAALQIVRDAWETGRNEPLHQAIEQSVNPAIAKAKGEAK